MATKGKVLVTGASGYIAGHCVRELLENGYSVRGTVRSLKSSHVDHLRALASRTRGQIDFVEADLTRDDGWRQAVEGCTYVQHVASPFPAKTPTDENELVRPAVEGTRRVLEACANTNGAVKRVVLTSSVAAVAFGRPPSEHVYNEEDWTVVEKSEPYQKSKTLAERSAWEFVKSLQGSHRFELAVINPGAVLGPLLGSDHGTSAEIVRRLMARDMPACPAIGFAIVDVRDVALAHRLAMEKPNAAGNRYICAGNHYWMRDIALILADEFGPQGYRVPTGKLPYWVLWLVARFDPTIRMTLNYIGRKELVSNEKIRRELGMEFRNVRETVVDMARSMIEQGVVPRKESVAAAQVEKKQAA